MWRRFASPFFSFVAPANAAAAAAVGDKTGSKSMAADGSQGRVERQ